MVELGGEPSSTGIRDLGLMDGFYEAAAELAQSSAPVVVLEVPSERIVAASPSGSILLDPGGDTVIGRNFEDFIIDGTSGVFERFASGHLTEYKMTWLLRRTGHDSLPAQVWLHKFDHQPLWRFVVALLAVTSPVRKTQETPAHLEPVLIGTADETLHIDRITNDSTELLGLTQDVFLGRSLTDVVGEHNRADLLTAVTTAATLNHAVTICVVPALTNWETTATVNGVGRCELVILPMKPSPSCAFVFLCDAPVSTPTGEPSHPESPTRLQTGSQLAETDDHRPDVSNRDVPGAAELTTREWEIVTRLLDADRVPAIAADLFLSQSTVRSHLALVFGKLNVSSQQELLDLMRGRRLHDH